MHLKTYLKTKIMEEHWMYERNEFLKFDYPKNLVSTIFNEEVDNICTWKVDEVLSSLEARQKKAMELRFKARMTYKNIGQELGVGPERASQFISYSIRRLRANRKHINLLAVPMGEHMSVQEYNKELLNEINKLNIGPGGLGGNVTALGVNIETYPTHIAGLPVAVNMCCHVNRHKKRVI